MQKSAREGIVRLRLKLTRTAIEGLSGDETRAVSGCFRLNLTIYSN
jgi:hypothetical protein